MDHQFGLRRRWSWHTFRRGLGVTGGHSNPFDSGPSPSSRGPGSLSVPDLIPVSSPEDCGQVADVDPNSLNPLHPRTGTFLPPDSGRGLQATWTGPVRFRTLGTRDRSGRTKGSYPGSRVQAVVETSSVTGVRTIVPLLWSRPQVWILGPGRVRVPGRATPFPLGCYRVSKRISPSWLLVHSRGQEPRGSGLGRSTSSSLVTGRDSGQGPDRRQGRRRGLGRLRVPPSNTPHERLRLPGSALSFFRSGEKPSGIPSHPSLPPP